MGDGAAREAWMCIVQLLRSEENTRRFSDAASKLGLSPGVQKALLDLAPDDPKPMRELASRWCCDASHVTSIVDQLEEKGLVQRLVPPNDRRVKTVALTEAGVAARNRLIEQLSAPPSAFSSLPVADQRALRDMLRKATTGLPPLK